MWRWLTISVVLGATSVFAEDERDPETVCGNEQNTCRDGCSMDFGVSYEKRAALMTCMSRCDERHDLCLLKFVAKRKVVIPPKPGEPKPADTGDKKDAVLAPYMMPRTRYSDPDPSAKPTEPAAPPKPNPPPPSTADSAATSDNAGTSSTPSKPRKKQVRESISKKKDDENP